MQRHRSPTVFIQFQSDVLTNVEPSHIVGVTTMKNLANPAGMFEIQLKTGPEKHAHHYAPREDVGSPDSVDYWFARIKPMTLCIIAMGEAPDVAVARRILQNEGNARRSPMDIMNGLGSEKPAFLRSIVMVGLVDEVTLTTAMSMQGPQRVLTVTGRDLGKILMDDNIRRIARGEDLDGIDPRMITLGDVPDEVAQRLKNRATLQANDRYWQPTVSGGMAVKQKLEEILYTTLYKAPGIMTVLDNANPVRNYFNTVDVSPELRRFYARGLLSLFWFNGPLWEALRQLAPPPLAELFVDTVGLQNVLIARRPPFFRPSTMPDYVQTVVDFLDVTNYDIDVAQQVLQPQETQVDAFTSVPSRVAENTYHTIEAEDIIVSAYGRSGVGTMAQYQVIPTIFMQGEASELAAQTGVTGAYLYDLAAGARFGTRLLQAACPWDLEGLAEPLPVPSPSQINEQNFSTKVLSGIDTVTEKAVAGAETVRLYYFFRDAAEFISGSLTIRAHPEIRVGDRILIPSFGNLIVYVESVQHSYRFGSAFVSQISFSHGQPLAPSGRLSTYEKAPPKIKVAGSKYKLFPGIEELPTFGPLNSPAPLSNNPFPPSNNPFAPPSNNP